MAQGDDVSLPFGTSRKSYAPRADRVEAGAERRGAHGVCVAEFALEQGCRAGPIFEPPALFGSLARPTSRAGRAPAAAGIEERGKSAAAHVEAASPRRAPVGAWQGGSSELMRIEPGSEALEVEPSRIGGVDVSPAAARRGGGPPPGPGAALPAGPRGGPALAWSCTPSGAARSAPGPSSSECSA
ncbi:unnamed protein product [Prorocentrum cordatum]|uniref:Uncharacterized protein n=1 Tax=Prorocentrum cordatum TaxID=2364126 RepID=A0ABN9P5U3_9DINO|nr:unnamed protein product [Polarella glacialis]